MAQIPSFVDRSPDLIMAEVKAQMEELLGRELHPAQFEQLVLQIICYREILLLERFNAGMAQLLYQFSQAPILDYVAALVAVERLPAAEAGCMVRFTLVGGHGAVMLPGGTRVATSGGVIFETGEDIEIDPFALEIETLVTAQEGGSAANGIAVGDVNVILDPQAWISGVENITVSGGGSDIENDESLRERIRLAPHQYSTAGSRQSYLFHAKSASPAIIDVAVWSDVPGTVCIAPLLESGEYAQVLDDIFKVCSAETVRPLTDTVIVSEPTEVHYSLWVLVEVYEGASWFDVEVRLLEALKEFTDGKARRLGQDIVLSQIISVCRIAEVYDVRIVTPDPIEGNIIVEFDEVPICDGINVTITGSNVG